MNKIIDELIKDFVSEYQKNADIKTKWKEPIIAYSDVNDEMFLKLKDIVGPSHRVPSDFLEDARSVVAYFLPFSNNISTSNIEGIKSSKEWALAYVETNTLIANINEHLKNHLEKLGYKLSSAPATHNFDEKKLISNWSHRHIGFIAGLGTFGINNMIITEMGCCGRIGTFITNLKLEPTKRSPNENCLYKDKNICGKCIDRCVNNALSYDYFDRHKCYEMCLYNAEFNSEIGLADVCGKCLVGLPCSINNPSSKTKE